MSSLSISLAMAALFSLARPSPWAQQTPAAVAAPAADAEAEFARLVPADAFLVARVRSLDNLFGTVDTIARAAGFSDVPSIVEGLINELELGAPREIIAADHPMGFASNLRPDGGVKTTVFFRVADARAAAESLAATANEHNRKVFAVGQWLVVTDLADYVSGTTPNQLALGLADGDVTLRIDLARLYETWRPLIDAALGQMETLIDQGAFDNSAQGVDASPIIESYLDWARALVDSAEALDVVVTRGGDDLELATTLRVREKSAMATALAGSAVELAPAARFIDPAAPLVYVIAGKPEMVAKLVSPMQDWLDAYPPATRAAIASNLAEVELVLPKLGELTVANVDLRPEGLQMTSYVQAKDPGALLAALREFWTASANEQLGVSSSGVTERGVGGANWLETKLSFDLEKTLAATGAPQDETANQTTRMMMDMLSALVGKDGLTIAATTKADQVIVVANGSDATRSEALARLDSATPALAQHAAATLRRANGASIAGIVRCDWPRVIDVVARALAAVQPAAQVEALSLFEGQTLPTTMWAAVAGREWRFGIGLQATALGQLIGTVRTRIAERERVERAREDLERLRDALARYAAEHDGRYPDSLPLLLAAGQSGSVYVEGGTLPVDPWERPYGYEPPREDHAARVFSLGRDGRAGGNGIDADIDAVVSAEADDTSPFIYKIF